MAGGILGQATGTVSTTSSAGASGVINVYTCPVSVSYAILHVFLEGMGCTAQSNVNMFGAGADISFRMGTFVWDTLSASANPNSSSSATLANKRTMSIVLGPGESIEFPYNLSPPSGGPGSASASYKAMVTGYEVA